MTYTVLQGNKGAIRNFREGFILCENKSLANGKITLLFIDVGKSFHKSRILNVENMSVNAIRENRIITKISELAVAILT